MLRGKKARVNPAKRAATSALPLRRVIDAVRIIPEGLSGPIPVERLECGHYQSIRHDIIG